jgi:hypothetical protein
MLSLTIIFFEGNILAQATTTFFGHLGAWGLNRDFPDNSFAVTVPAPL